MLAGSQIGAAGWSQVTQAGDAPLVEVSTEAGRGLVVDLRVRPNGRFEVRERPHAWDLISKYTPRELAELRREMERANHPPLPAVVKPRGVVSDPVRQTWRLRLADGPREVVSEQFTEDALPRLERLYHKLFTIPRAAVRESRWRVRTDTGVVKRTVIGEVTFIPVLEPMLGALYHRPNPLKAIGRGVPPKRLLLDVSYFVDGKRDGRLSIAPGGRAYSTERTKSVEIRRLNADELAELQRAIELTGWPELPEPITKRTKPVSR